MSQTVAFAILAVALAAAPSAVHGDSPTLTFEDRIRAQEAIERVYYSHQIGATKPFEEAVPQSLLEARVREYLKQSVALEQIWEAPITTEMLQEELQRMTRRTQMPDRLRKLFAALDDDPALIRECLVRPRLAGRLIRESSASDSETQGAVRMEPHTIHGAPVGDTVDSRHAYPRPSHFELNRGRRFAPSGSGLQDCPLEYRFGAAAVWTGSQLLVWGGYRGGHLNTGARYDPATDTWTATSTVGAPSARQVHSAVWTGSHMLIWGGYGGSDLNSGGRYDPATDTWAEMSTAGAPSPRGQHTGVWTGSRMLVWGGITGSWVRTNTGGLYDPVSDSWSPTSTEGAPDARWQHTGVWTGSRMLIWGGKSTVGNSGPGLDTGGRYDPITDTWVSTSTSNAPSLRRLHGAVWTGSQMLVWGGWTDQGLPLDTGGRYDPVNDTWMSMSTGGAPSARTFHSAVWTGSLMVVWGGYGDTYLNSGGRYDPVTDTWTPTTITGAPPPAGSHTAVNANGRVLIWGAGGISGGLYDPAIDTWTPTSTFLEDTQSPVISCPPAIDVACPGDTAPANTGEPTATDDCTVELIEYSDLSTPGCGLTETLTRTWTATDETGKSSECVQTITVSDTAAPFLAPSPDVSIIVDDEAGIPATDDRIVGWLGIATAEDGCGDVTLGHDAPTHFPMGETVVTFTAEDECGNVATASSALTLLRGCPDMLAAECTEQDPCQVLDPENVCPPEAEVTRNLVSIEPDQATYCAGEEILILHRGHGSFVDTQDSSIEVCAADCHENCYASCVEVDVQDCYEGCVRRCANGACVEWGEICNVVGVEVRCNNVCFEECEQNYIEETGQASFARDCGYEIADAFDLREADEICTGTLLETITVTGAGTAGTNTTAPVTPGNYELCDGTLLIKAFTVEDCGPACRILASRNAYHLREGQSRWLPIIIESSGTGGTYALSLARYYDDEHTMPMGVPTFLSIPESVDVPMDEARAFDIRATNAQSEGGQDYWGNILIEASGPAECDRAIAVQIVDEICRPPEDLVRIIDAGRSANDGNLVLHFVDLNQPASVTGYNVYRSAHPSLQHELWSLVATDVPDEDEMMPGYQWTDPSGDPGTWYYQVAAYNSLCPVDTAEGPW